MRKSTQKNRKKIYSGKENNNYLCFRMRIVVQRVTSASVSIAGDVHASVGRGLMILVGVENGDTADDARWLAEKTSSLRIFPDENQIMNLSVTQTGGEILAVSQFTLTASTRRGNRPSYIRAAKGNEAETLYNNYCTFLSEAADRDVKKGVFGADMQVDLINDGPVTIIIDSRLKE